MKQKLKNLWENMPKVWQDRLLEVSRWFVIGVFSILDQGGEIDKAAVQTLLLRIVDKAIHLWGKKEDIGWLIKGLTRF
jgi:hypothetical protein